MRELDHGAKSSTNRREILGKHGIQPLRHNRQRRANLADSRKRHYGIELRSRTSQVFKIGAIDNLAING
jgi:hypothetical protein